MEKTLSLAPLSEYFIFSKCMNCSWLLKHNHGAAGGLVDFHNNTLLGAISVIMVLCLSLTVECTPSVTGQGVTKTYGLDW